MRDFWYWLGIFGPFLTWIILLIWMCQNYLTYPPDPNITVPDLAGHNLEGELQGNFLFSLIELVGFYFFLRPLSSRYLLKRIFLTLLIFFPWMVLWLVLSFHSGGVTFLRWMWLFLLNIGLLIGLVGAIAYPSRRMRKTRRQGDREIGR